MLWMTGCAENPSSLPRKAHPASADVGMPVAQAEDQGDVEEALQSVVEMLAVLLLSSMFVACTDLV
tara:strand:+ start:337 stop:534 length:198 start_codon:yes stop_codon:yes gene_type:complete